MIQMSVYSFETFLLGLLVILHHVPLPVHHLHIGTTIASSVLLFPALLLQVEAQQQDSSSSLIYDNFYDIASSLRSLIDSSTTTLTGNWANDLNEDNDAVGTAVVNGYLRPWVWSSTTNSAAFLPLPDDRPYGGQPHTISDRFLDGTQEALIVANLQKDVFDEPGHAYIWHLNMATMEILESYELGVWQNRDRTIALSVNQRGQVLAKSTRFFLSDIVFIHDFATKSYEMIEFPVGPADMNNNGDLVGGTYIGINTIPGDFSTMQIKNVGLPTNPEFNAGDASLTAINSSGQAAATILKTYSDGAGRRTRAFSRYNGTAYDLDYDGGAFAGAIDISDNGNVLGVIGAGGSIIPFMYVQETNSFHSVNSLLDPQLTAANPTFYMYDANAMNNAGVIAGSFTDGAVLLIPRNTVVNEGYCVDSTLRMKKGSKTKPCSWVANMVTKRCTKRHKSHCPVTCSDCENHKCTDSLKPFYIDAIQSMKSCRWVRKEDTVARCQLEGVDTACRKSCGACVV